MFISPYIKTNAILLKKEDVRSSSLKMFCHTHECGRMSLQIKGYYRSKEFKIHPVINGAAYEIVFLKQKNTETPVVKEMDVQFVPGVKDYNELSLLHHFLEFLLNITTENKKEHALLYNLYVNFCSLLSKMKIQDPLLLVLLTHELIALKILGFITDLSSCPLCSELFKKGDRGYFSIEDNTFYCEQCQKNKESIFLSGKIFSFFKSIMEDQITPKKVKEILQGKIYPLNEQRNLYVIVQHLLGNVFGNDFKSGIFLSRQLMQKYRPEEAMC